MVAHAVDLGQLAQRVQPVALAPERTLPLLPPLEPLFPGGGLRRGSVVGVCGSTSLGLALAAGASAAGSWCAAVGLPSLGLVAAGELGIALQRFPVVASPAQTGWGWVVAALLDAFDVVLAWPPRRAPRAMEADVRRLAARAREQGGALVVMGDVKGVDVRLHVVSTTWQGVGDGYGRLRARRVEVVGGGRGAAARERRLRLWLPGPDGGVASITEPDQDLVTQRRAAQRRVG